MGTTPPPSSIDRAAQALARMTGGVVVDLSPADEETIGIWLSSDQSDADDIPF